MVKISVIMPSFLEYYEGAASNREFKFKRAVDSFIKQEYQEKELIIISDGCEMTMIISALYAFNPQIKVHRIPKQELFSGAVRNMGLFYATGQVITYLDSDDFYENTNHLNSIANVFNFYPEKDWIYFNDYAVYNMNPMTGAVLSKAERTARLEKGSIGTSNIAHRKNNMINWDNCNGYGHDWTFISKLLNKEPNPIKIDGTSYNVCHIPNSFDN